MLMDKGLRIVKMEMVTATGKVIIKFHTKSFLYVFVEGILSAYLVKTWQV